MTYQEACLKMQECIELSYDDPEVAHSQADKILCDYLKSLGFGDITLLFQEVKKWYA